MASAAILSGLNSTKTNAGQSVSRRHLLWAVLFVLALVPIALMSIYSEQIASASVRELIRAGDLSETGNVAMLLQQDMSKTVALAEAFAGSEGTARLLDNDDILGIVTRLKGLTLAFPALASAVIAEPSGRTVYGYPTESAGQSSRVQFLASVAQSNRPGISAAMKDVSGTVIIVAAPVLSLARWAPASGSRRSRK